MYWPTILFFVLTVSMKAQSVTIFTKDQTNPIEIFDKILDVEKNNHLIKKDQVNNNQEPYQPTWESLDKRPLPSWYDEAKFGIFIHWGVFSVPSYVSEWFWWYWKGIKRPDVVDFMNKNYPPQFTYADFAKEFTAEFFDADQWADLFKDSGAQYIVLTSKHHEGFTNWPSEVSWNWNSMDVGPHRDLVGELADAIKNHTSLHFGLYHSLFEWFHPKYIQDKKNNFTTQSFIFDKTMPELYDLVNKYEPDVIWSDGDFGPTEYWNSKEFLAWLYNYSSVKDTVVTNDRWGTNVRCHHGGFYTCYDRYNPGKLVRHKWENCMTLDRYSWGYRRKMNINDVLSIEEVIYTLASTISCGGNLLMNVGPTKEGTISPIFQQRLQQIGAWLKINGEAVYSSKPWRSQSDTFNKNVWYTSKNDSVYAFVLQWPKNNLLVLSDPVGNETSSVITMLGYNDSNKLSWKSINDEINIILPDVNPQQLKWAWVLKLSNFQ